MKRYIINARFIVHARTELGAKRAFNRAGLGVIVSCVEDTNEDLFARGVEGPK